MLFIVRLFIISLLDTKLIKSYKYSQGPRGGMLGTPIILLKHGEAKIFCSGGFETLFKARVQALKPLLLLPFVWA